MFYEIENNKISTKLIDNVALNDKKQYFGFFNFDEGKTVIQKFGFNDKLLTDSITNKSMIFENHEGFDFICLNILNRKKLTSQTDKVCIYMNKNMMLFICTNIPLIEKIFHEITENETLSIGFDRLLCTFFEKLTVDEVVYLEKIEQEISDLENALITSKKRDCIEEIILFRKKLMALKRYYEQLLNVLDELQENENNILHGNSLRYFKIYTGKVERRYHNVLNLRDYVTQVREAYQAEVDIDLNSIMKIFTVITAIFLPLTLLVGWYGMNLQMPEFKWAYSYPVVIILSIAVVVFCLVYFKKHKWF